MKKSGLFFSILIITGTTILAQSPGSSWQRSDDRAEIGLHLFHSPHVINLPTAETLQKGNFEFEISHRFIPPFDDGFESLYGLDGPVNMRIGLGYAATDRMVVTLARSNVLDNVDLNLKYRAFELDNGSLPVLVAFFGGISWTTEDVFGRSRGNSRNFQYYVMAVANTMFEDRVALGVAPAYLYNSNIFSQDYEDIFILGSYVQVYVSELLSFMMEWSPAISNNDPNYNSASVGFELETGGHFFKIFASNSTMLNPSQYLSGSAYEFKSDELRLGFMITRILKF